MSGAVLEYTLRYNMEIPNFDFPNWHTYYARTLKTIDGLIYMLSGVSNIRGPWRTDTVFNSNDRVIDLDDNTLWICNVNHTSGTGTFANDRATNPTYWTQVTFDDVQPLNDILTAISGAGTPVADNVIYFTSGSTTARFSIPSAMRTAISAGATLAAFRAAIGLVIGTDVQAQNANLQWLADNITAAGQALLDDISAQKQRLTLGATTVGDAVFIAATTLAARTALDINGAYPKTVTLTDGASVALDAALGDTFSLTAAGNRTIQPPTNPKRDGDRIIIRHKASGGDRTLSLNTGANGFRFTADVPALTVTLSGLTDYVSCIWNAADTKWDVIGYIKGV